MAPDVAKGANVTFGNVPNITLAPFFTF